jgi:RNA polymerase sigma-70 factor (ECF subfamily)
MDGNQLDGRLARAKGGDVEAWSALLAEQTPRLLRMVELRLDPRGRKLCDPHDVVQDALLEAARRFDEWRTQDRFPLQLWLRLLTAQCLVRMQRRHMATQKRDVRLERPLEDVRADVSSLAAADWLASSITSPSQAARRSEVRDLVLAALDELEELDREILVLRHFEQLSNEEAALELAIEPAAASKRFARALQRLRPALRALDSGEGGSA